MREKFKATGAIAVCMMMVLASAAFGGNLGGDIGVHELFDPAARTTTVGTYGSKVVDRRNYRSSVVELNSAKSSAGSACSLYVKMQESDAAARVSWNNATAGADSVANGLRVDSSSISFAVYFKPTTATSISKIYLNMREEGTVTDGKKIWVSVYKDSAGEPLNTVYHADSYDTLLVDSLSSSWELMMFELDRPLTLTTTDSFQVVIEADYTISGTNYIAFQTETETSGGDFSYQDSAGTWTAVTTKDGVGYLMEYTFTDISSAELDTATHVIPMFDTYDLALRPQKQYIRALGTVVGTSGSFICGAAFIGGEARIKPVTD